MTILGPTPIRRLNEAGGVVLLAGAVCLTLSLVSYHSTDPSWNTAAGTAVSALRTTIQRTRCVGANRCVRPRRAATNTTNVVRRGEPMCSPTTRRNEYNQRGGIDDCDDINAGEHTGSPLHNVYQCITLRQGNPMHARHSMNRTAD